MTAVVSLIGLIVSSSASIWLLSHEIAERSERAWRLKELADFRHRVGVFQGLITETVQNVLEVNKQLGHAAYDVAQETAATRKNLDDAQKKLAAFENPLMPF